MDEQFQKNLRDALNNLYNPDQLRKNPLVAVFGVEGRSDTPVAMQKALENMIHALKPKLGEGLRSQRRRAYDILYSRYIDQFSQKEVAEQLGVSLRTYQREQQTALDLLAALIAEKYTSDIKEAMPWSPSLKNAKMENQNEHRDMNVDEFAWMFDPSAERAVELDQVLKRLQVFIQPLVNRYSVSLNYEIDANLPTIAANPEALLQILVNLLSVFLHQAIRGNIRFSAMLRQGTVVIQLVTSPINLDLCHPSDADLSSVDIVRQLVQLSEGSFNYSLINNTYFAQVKLPVYEALPVLVIDDSIDNIKLIQRYLTGTRYRMIGLNQPERALEVIENSLPQAVILDLMMPQVDGLEILARMRALPSDSYIPIIVCTILPQEELTLSLGASAFLRKPISRENLLNVLDDLILSKEQDSDPQEE